MGSKDFLKDLARMFLLPFAITLRAIEGAAPVLYHVGVVALSAGIALSLPFTVSSLATNLLIYWSLIENEKVFLISLEIAVALLLILLFNYVGSGWRHRKFSHMALGAGMLYFSAGRGRLARRRIRKLKENQGFARDIMIIGSTGFRTFVHPRGDLHGAVRNCREAKIMLLDPKSEGARTRAKSILHADVTPESFREQIVKTIHFLKGLKAIQKNVKLKLYQDAPLLKLAVLGDYIWMQHYHPGLDVRAMPEYMFTHNQDPGGLYAPVYQYVLTRWENPGIPEYDLETDELVYKDMGGAEVRREKFDDAEDRSKGDTVLSLLERRQTGLLFENKELFGFHALAWRLPPPSSEWS